MEKAAAYFTRTAVKIDPNKKIHISVTNIHHHQKDEIAREIETEFYFALERQFSDFKLFLEPPQDKDVFLQGSYEKKGSTIVVRFQAFRQNTNGEILGSVSVVYQVEEKRKKSLVAVLDLESDSLGAVEKRAYSELFRSEISNSQAFLMASSADVDRMAPDQIQEATGCTRDSCAAIIGEQLGVDRVISWSLFKLGKQNYILSAKITDIASGTIVSTATIQHRKPLIDLPDSLGVLAKKLTRRQGESGKSTPVTGSGEVAKAGLSSSILNADKEYWQEIRNSTSIHDFKKYLSLFPQGAYGETARLKILKLKADMVVVDEKTGLSWQKKTESEMISWAEARDYCNKLEIAGSADWRLPDKDELKSAYKIKDRFSDLPRSRFWSSSETSGGERVYFVYFAHGQVGHTGKNASGYPLCVKFLK
jgi:Protein of unknown function (DUF1566)